MVKNTKRTGGKGKKKDSKASKVKGRAAPVRASKPKAKVSGKSSAKKALAKKGAASPARTGKAPSFRGLGLKEAAAAVHASLVGGGHEPILGGQACAAIYGGQTIKSRTLEFAIREFSVTKVNALMGALGFLPKEARTYTNVSCPFEVVLVAAPLTVGDDAIDGSRMIKTSSGPLRMLTPTDCVRQRLSMFYRWGDRSALAEAVQVAKRQAIDMDLVCRWSEWEWATDRYQEFLRALEASR